MSAIARFGAELVGFQEDTSAFDDLAARVLGLERRDLPYLTLLCFGGPASITALAAARAESRSDVVATVDRLQRAGYARRQPGPGARVELTAHAGAWIERIWAPLREDGDRLLAACAPADLDRMQELLARARKSQARQARRLRRWLRQPGGLPRTAHLRGGLPPAALRRVQVYVEANLDRPLRLADLARRAGLSVFHFARAFRVATGLTPRAFVEARRVERARLLIRDTARPLAAIALEAGFATQSRLTTAFKRHTGFTPAAFRRGGR